MQPSSLLNDKKFNRINRLFNSGCISTLNVLAAGPSETFRWYIFIRLHRVSQWTTITIFIT
jgi:hypothetical protein